MSYHRAVQQREIQQNQGSQNPIGVQLSTSDKERIKSTDQFQISAETKRNHRERLKEMMEFIKKKYPTYSRECIRDLTSEDLDAPSMIWLAQGLNLRMYNVYYTKSLFLNIDFSPCHVRSNGSIR